MFPKKSRKRESIPWNSIIYMSDWRRVHTVSINIFASRDQSKTIIFKTTFYLSTTLNVRRNHHVTVVSPECRSATQQLFWRHESFILRHVDCVDCNFWKCHSDFSLLFCFLALLCDLRCASSQHWSIVSNNAHTPTRTNDPRINITLSNHT